MTDSAQRWVPTFRRELPRVASRAASEWFLHNTPEHGDLLPLRPYPPLQLPEHIVQAAIEAASHPKSAPSRGMLSLREAIAAHLHTTLGVEIDPEKHVLVTNGGNNALHIALLTLLEPGDEVIAPAPCYFLDGLVKGLGAKLVFVPMDEQNGFRWDIERIEQALTKRSKVLFLNTPVNPTGCVLTREELQQIGRMAARHGLCILADESYERLTFDGRKHVSPLALPECREHTVMVRSFTKSFIMAAWRVGFIVAGAGLMGEFLKTSEWIHLYVSHVPQAAAAAAMAGPQTWLADAAAILQANRDRLVAAIRATEVLTCVEPQGGPFVFPNVSQSGLDGDAFATLLSRGYGVSATAGSALQGPQHVRIPMGASTEVIDELVRRLQSALQRIREQR